MNDEVLQALLESKRAAAAVARECVDAAATGTLGKDRLAESLRSYILAKYHITEEDCASDSMDELSHASMDKLAVLGADAYEGDTASNCDGADSAAVKHAFLMMAIQRDFGVTFDGFAAGRAKTVGDVADLVFVGLTGRDDWAV